MVHAGQYSHWAGVVIRTGASGATGAALAESGKQRREDVAQRDDQQQQDKQGQDVRRPERVPRALGLAAHLAQYSRRAGRLIGGGAFLIDRRRDW
jgi:hypothetical protein